MAYFLGLDIGVQSIGWAVIPKNAADFEKLAMGVHLFEGGTDGDIEKGVSVILSMGGNEKI